MAYCRASDHFHTRCWSAPRNRLDHPHRILFLIIIVLQFKLFSLPGLVACGKYKVTANEGWQKWNGKYVAIFFFRCRSEKSKNISLWMSCGIITPFPPYSSMKGIISESDSVGELPPLFVKSWWNFRLFPTRFKVSGNLYGSVNKERKSLIQMKVSAVRNDNHVGISSFVFSDTGKGRKL